MKKLFWMILLILTGTNFVSAQSRAKLFEIAEIPSAKTDKSSLASVRESEIEFSELNFHETETLE